MASIISIVFFWFSSGIILLLYVFSTYGQEDNGNSSRMVEKPKLVTNLTLPNKIGGYKSIPTVVDYVKYTNLLTLISLFENNGYYVRHAIDVSISQETMIYKTIVISDNNITVHNRDMEVNIFPINYQDLVVIELPLSIELEGFLKINKTGFHGATIIESGKIERNNTSLSYTGSNLLIMNQIMRWNPLIDLYIELLHFSPESEITIRNNTVQFVIKFRNSSIYNSVKILFEIGLVLNNLSEYIRDMHLFDHNGSAVEIATKYNPNFPCIICFQPIETVNYQESVYLPCCGLNAHTDHLNIWLSIKNYCPNCKSEKIESKVIIY